MNLHHELTFSERRLEVGMSVKTQPVAPYSSPLIPGGDIHRGFAQLFRFPDASPGQFCLGFAVLG